MAGHPKDDLLYKICLRVLAYLVHRVFVVVVVVVFLGEMIH